MLHTIKQIAKNVTLKLTLNDNARNTPIKQKYMILRTQIHQIHSDSYAKLGGGGGKKSIKIKKIADATHDLCK